MVLLLLLLREARLRILRRTLVIGVGAPLHGRRAGAGFGHLEVYWVVLDARRPSEPGDSSFFFCSPLDSSKWFEVVRPNMK